MSHSLFSLTNPWISLDGCQHNVMPCILLYDNSRMNGAYDLSP